MRFPGKMLFVALAHLFKRPITVLYPFVKVTMPLHFRGKLKFESAKCIGCKLCMKDCPANAIDIRKVGEKMFACDIDTSKCIYCAQCVDSCPKKALRASEEFELAALDRANLKITYEATAPTPSLAADGTSAPTAVTTPSESPKQEKNDSSAGQAGTSK